MDASRRLAGESGALLAGAVVNGLAAYGFVALGTRALGAEGFAPVAIVWAFWAFSAALLTFPIQHWVIRQMALDRHSGGVRAAAGRVTLLAVALAAGEGLVALAAGRALFGDGSWVWPACVTGVALGTGFMGLLRGVLAGSGRYRAAAVAIGGENLIRLAVGGAVLAASRDPRLLAAALMSGPLIALLWPRALRLDPVAGPSPSTGLVGAAGLSLVLSQAVLYGGPPVVAALGGAEAEVTALFSALAIFRAPYLMALGLTVRATAPLTRRVEGGGRGSLRAPALGVAAASVALAAAAFGAAWPGGPPLIRALFGPGTAPSGPVTGAGAAGCVLALGGLALTLMLIVVGARAALVSCWAVAVAVGGLVLGLAGGLEPTARVAVAFVGAEAAAVAAATVALVVARSR